MATSFLLPLQLMLLITINIFFMLTSSAPLTDFNTDRDALLAFKKAITVDTSGALSKKWLTNTSICDWAGVSCGTKHHRVTALDHSNFGLHGILSPHLGNLTFLQFLDVSSNNFTGRLPAELSKLCRLKLVSATSNNFTGKILRGILTNMSVLEYIDLSFNNLTGALPSDICKNTPKLKRLSLVTNQIYGKIPRSIHKCSKMEELSLSTNMFNGNIPTEVGNLTMLTLLSIYDNDLQGNIPSSIFNVSRLKFIYLDDNKLSGSIPKNLDNLLSLQVLRLSNNNLTGEIPTSITNASQLGFIQMSSNSFIGTIPDLGNLRQLRFLSLRENNLSGVELGFLSSFTNCPNLNVLHITNNLMMNSTLPSSFGNLSTSLISFSASNCSIRGKIPAAIGNFRNLVILDLSNNQLTGSIPTTFSIRCSLQSLYLNVNKLEGSLPRSLSNCRTLQLLNFGNNRIQDTFPFWMEKLTYLRVLVLASNNFSGNISSPKATLPFPKLQVFDISHNAFVGDLPHGYIRNFKVMMDVQENRRGEQVYIPIYLQSFILRVKGCDREYTKILKIFTTIDMSCNRFSGRIQNTIGNLHSLIHLNLSHNCLTGGIPASLGNLTELESLDLSSNQLEGEIPTELTKLTFLSVMNLSMNTLSGKIPQSNGQLSTFDNTSYVGNSRLCGFPLSRKCEGPSPPLMMKEDDHDHDYGILEGFCWQAVVSGYGCGFVVGGIVGCLILGYGRPKWLVEWIYRFYRIKMRSSRRNVAPQRRRRQEG